jgi:FHS family glucose/mannose:H+ symporter-like MFS transporter
MRCAWATTCISVSAEAVSGATTKFTIGLIYFAAVVQGLALVTFPAAGTIFTSDSGFGLSAARYGEMFIPQVVLAIAASSLAPWLAGQLGLRGVLLLGLAGDVLSMALLSASPLLIGSPAAFIVLLIATGALGLGFGATVMALNTLVEGLFPGRADGAVLALNALLGLGTALAPVLVALFAGLGAWWVLPLFVAILAAVLLVAFAWSNAPLGAPHAATPAQGGLPSRFWLYASATLLYGVVETLSGNWATLYLSTERHVSTQGASFALTAFWLMVTLGRMLFALLGGVLSTKWVYVALPFLLAIVFQFVTRIDGASAGVAGFGAAGLACSAFLPLSISFSGAEFPRRADAMSGELIAFYQIGYGIAAFGVGPLREIGFAYSTAFSIGSLIAVALGVLALLVVRRPAHPTPRGRVGPPSRQQFRSKLASTRR